MSAIVDAWYIWGKMFQFENDWRRRLLLEVALSTELSETYAVNVLQCCNFIIMKDYGGSQAFTIIMHLFIVFLWIIKYIQVQHNFTFTGQYT